jgi:hypothetical protein
MRHIDATGICVVNPDDSLCSEQCRLIGCTREAQSSLGKDRLSVKEPGTLRYFLVILRGRKVLLWNLRAWRRTRARRHQLIVDLIDL